MVKQNRKQISEVKNRRKDNDLFGIPVKANKENY